MHTVAVLAFPGAIMFDLATPLEVFRHVRLLDGSPGYRVIVCGPPGELDAGDLRVIAPHGLDALEGADTIMVPGRIVADAPVPGEVLEALHRAAAQGTRIASICVGAFVLAAAGLLDGARATTHWIAADRLQRMFPRVEVDPAVLFVDNGQLLTAAGAAAGIDLCLHMVRIDYGAAVAADAARSAVVPLQRDGGQAQFIVRRPASAPNGSLSTLLDWMETNAHRDLTLGEIAVRASVSIRTLNRRFHDQVGATPMQWLNQTRVRLAQELLETTGISVDHVSRQAGFPSVAYFRIQFKRATGVTPQTYRRSFRAPTAA